MRIPAPPVLVGGNEEAGLRNEAGAMSRAGGWCGAGWRHELRNEADAWGAACTPKLEERRRELRAGWRGSCEGGFFPEVRLRADPADRIGDFTQLFVMRRRRSSVRTTERSEGVQALGDWCQGGRDPPTVGRQPPDKARRRITKVV